MARTSREVTELLRDVSRGDQRAIDQFLPLVYEQLRSLAAHYLRAERRDHTLQATGLVHEAYLRLVGSDGEAWENRGHFYRVAAKAMRRILVDHARCHGAAKRGGGLRRVSLTEAERLASLPDPDLVALDEALTRLDGLDPRKSQVVELRYFGGLSGEETARALGVSLRSVERDWSLARAWLFREIRS